MICAGCARGVDRPAYDDEMRAWHPGCLKERRNQRRNDPPPGPEESPTQAYLRWGTAKFGL